MQKHLKNVTKPLSYRKRSDTGFKFCMSMNKISRLIKETIEYNSKGDKRNKRVILFECFYLNLNTIQ